MCGEQLLIRCLFQQKPGSPPRVRGTASLTVTFRDNARITPACAGNSYRNSDKTFSERDHPRVCGEQAHIFDNIENGGGSPPRVRGTAIPAHKAPQARRITPACAGNRYLHPGFCTTQEDHPRVCGEQAFLRGFLTVRIGSPPRVRGTASRSGKAWPLIRITPACAGNRIAPLLLMMRL